MADRQKSDRLCLARYARHHFSRAKDMSATYVALQGEDTDDSKHPDPVTAPAAGHPAPVLHVIQNHPRRVHRGALTVRHVLFFLFSYRGFRARPGADSSREIQPQKHRA